MRKAVLISIKPKWCERIASGKKTVEVRKTAPKNGPPFKCYIYCTNPSYPHEDFFVIDAGTKKYKAFYGGGKVIGEFICDSIGIYHPGSCFTDERLVFSLRVLSCLTPKEICNYSNGKPIYGWRISNLKIYDQPKELGDFKSYYGKCEIVDGYPVPATDRSITRTPQSWMYVEENDG